MFGVWRRLWDVEEQASGPYATEEESLRQLRRLLLFFSPLRDGGDVARLRWYGSRQITTSDVVPCVGEQWPAAYGQLQTACLIALKTSRQRDYASDREILGILAFVARHSTHTTAEAIRYYEALVSTPGLPKEQLQGALLAPLQHSAEAYTGVVVLLARPLDVDMLQLLRAAIDPEALSRAVAQLDLARFDTRNDTRKRLWLLGNLIFVTRRSTTLLFTDAVARLLGPLADEVSFEEAVLDIDNQTYDQEILSKLAGAPLNTYLHQQITSLLDRHSIQNLLAGHQNNNLRGSTDAQILAGYALTLLRCFPTKADDIRMWLHLGPTSSDSSPTPTQFLWEAAKSSLVFADIWATSRGVVSLLKTAYPTQQQKDDWTIVLVFLEMFTFDLKIMDDEEFMGNSPVRKRNSAVPIPDVARLVTFLKNLGFTLYYDAAELNEATPPRRERASAMETKSLTVAGLPGLTIDYLKGLVTGLLRSIYERDSRRKFLLPDHWLMTDRFDMTMFIPGVVAEEESRNQVREQDDEDKDDDSDDDDDLEPAGRIGSSGVYARARLLRSQEARARAQRKASRKRYLESVAPRLEILQNMPFFIPFYTRVQIFRQFVRHDQEKRRNGHVDPDLWRQNIMFQPQAQGGPPRDLLARHHAKIKRGEEFQDAYDQFYALGADLKEPIQITFVDRWDMPEAGIDGGGVTKEFLTSVISQAFDPGKAGGGGDQERFFVENEQHLLHPNPVAFENLKVRCGERGFGEDSMQVREEFRELYRQYEFLGRIIGKCLYEGILVDVSFAGFFLKKWALTGGSGSVAGESHYRPSINDLRELDEGLYRGLLAVKHADDAEELGITFTVNDFVGSSPDGKKGQKVIETELIPNGSEIAVTNENRLAYISKLATYRLQLQDWKQSRGFLRGLSEIVSPSWLSMFNQTELQTLIGGAGGGIDIEDLRRHTTYGGLYVIGDDGEEHSTVKMFWDVMKGFEEGERRKVLKFVTSTPRGPLLGFGVLEPRFCIRDSGGDESRYPSASTCVNLLKLPVYRDREGLRGKLLGALEGSGGFDLS